MRIFVLPTVATIVVDICAWFLLHMGISKWLTGWDVRRFKPGTWLYRERGWEKGGILYKRVFRVQFWKKRLPDAAPWFEGGIAKKSLPSLSRNFLQRFIVESCRGELAHWFSMGIAPIFFLWNPPWVGGIMVIYAVIANLPCIIVQRYNRIRYSCLVNKMSQCEVP